MWDSSLNKTVLQFANDPRVRWWNLEHNGNDSGATPRNYALKMMVRTELVAYLDDDNYWEPDHLKTLFEVLKKIISIVPI